MTGTTTVHEIFFKLMLTSLIFGIAAQWGYARTYFNYQRERFFFVASVTLWSIWLICVLGTIWTF